MQDVNNPYRGGGISKPDGQPPSEKPWQPRTEDVNLWSHETSPDGGYYRIPAVLTTKDDVIIAFTDWRNRTAADVGLGKGDVVSVRSKRSTDGGKTWSEEVVVGNIESKNNFQSYGDVCVFEAANGDIVALCAAAGGWFNGENQNANGGSRVYMSRSKDKGRTWTDWTDNEVTEQIKNTVKTAAKHGTGSEDLTTFYKGFVGSGRGLTSSRDGNLYAAMLVSLGNEDGSIKKESTLVIRSKDHGQTWESVAVVHGSNQNEPKMTECGNGDLLLNIRGGTRIFYRSPDMGKTWVKLNNPLQDHGCNAETIYYGKVEGKDVYLLSHPTNGRNDGRISAFAIEGDTVVPFAKKSIIKGSFAYSSLDTLSDGSVVSIDEAPGNFIRFRRFSYDWILSDVPDPSKRPPITNAPRPVTIHDFEKTKSDRDITVETDGTDINSTPAGGWGGFFLPPEVKYLEFDHASDKPFAVIVGADSGNTGNYVSLFPVAAGNNKGDYSLVDDTGKGGAFITNINGYNPADSSTGKFTVSVEGTTVTIKKETHTVWSGEVSALGNKTCSVPRLGLRSSWSFNGADAAFSNVKIASEAP